MKPHTHEQAAAAARKYATRYTNYVTGELRAPVDPERWIRLYMRKYRHLTGRLPFAGPVRGRTS